MQRQNDSTAAEPPERDRRVDERDRRHRSSSGGTRFPVPDADLDERSVRARSETMLVRSVGPYTYEVDSESGNTYTVVPTDQRCTCPDHAIRGERCKHLRRVALEINAGRVPPPGRIAEPCRRCGEPVYVRPGDDRPTYCERHRLSVGDEAVDRETGRRVIVVGVSDRRADEVYLDAATSTVAAYPGNEAYDPADRVVAAIYPDVDIDEHGADDLRVYSFPRGRLAPLSAANASRR